MGEGFDDMNSKQQQAEEWSDLSNIYERFDQSDFSSIFEFLKVYRYKQKKRRRLDIFKAGAYKSGNTIFSHANENEEEK